MERIDLHSKSGDGFKPTQDELETIRKKMDDPEFVKLWAEYAQTLADPKVRAEEEEYLRQMEREARDGGDDSFDFVFPTPVFCVELLQDGRGQTTVVNMCESDKVDEFTERSTGDRMASNWHVPVTVGKAHTERWAGKEYAVYDAVFHPKTVALADRSDRFMCFLVEIAVEHINGGYQQQFGFEFRRVSSSTKSLGTPANQTVRREKNKGAFPMSDEPASTGPQRPASLLSKAAAQLGQQPPPAAPAAPKGPTPAEKRRQEQERQEAARKEKELRERVPKYTLSHRGEIDLTATWDFGREEQSKTRVGVPRQFVLKFELPKVERASALDVDVQPRYVHLAAASAPYDVTVDLPFEVEEVPASAKFEKSQRHLTLLLNVVPPPAPAAAPAPEGSAPAEVAEAVPEISDAEAAERKTAAAAREAAEEAERRARIEQALRKGQQRDEAESEAASKKAEEAKEAEEEAARAAAYKAKVEAPAAPSAAAVLGGDDRMAQLQAKLAEARREREAAEAAADLKEEAEAAKAKAAHVDPAVAAPPAAPVVEEKSAEPVDLRGTMKSHEQRRREEETAAADAAEAELDAVLAEAQEATEAAARAQEEEERQKRELQEAQRRAVQEREEERLAALLAQKTAELPLTSPHIFTID